MNQRRRLLLVAGASALAAPFGSFAQQQSKVWRVGFLSPRSRPDSIDADAYGAFPRGMRELGYIEGKNLEIQWRYAEGKLERLPGLAAELVQLKVDALITVSPPATSAAQKATTTIPIVFQSIGDPVGLGFIKSLAHPGGNTTGFSNLAGDLGPKRLEMLLDMAPKLSRVAFMMNPGNSSHAQVLKSTEAAARKRNVKIVPVEVRTAQDLANAFTLMTRENAQAFIVAQDPLFTQQSRQIADLAVTSRLPSIYGLREYADAGGLMSYGPNLSHLYWRAATYVDKIFKGAKPADLPVEQPTKFELFINGKTVKALGLKIPQSLLITADRVIE
jgi:putative ABC transport system substrate-binding protein